MDPAWAAIAAVTSPLALVILNGWQQRKSNRENWRRQDEVAARAAEVAKVVTQTGATLRANQAALEEIHTLVATELVSSAELSEAQHRELVAVEELLARSREVVELKRAMGTEPSVADEDALLELEIRIEAMTRSLSPREPSATEYPSRLGP